MTYHLFQRIKGTDEYYYDGQVDTGGSNVWIKQYVGDPTRAPSLTSVYTQLSYLRETEDAYVAEVDKPIGGAQRMVVPMPDSAPFYSKPQHFHGWISSSGYN